MRRSVRIAKTVTAEIPVMMQLTEVSTVAVFYVAFFSLTYRKCVVTPFPDKSSHKSVIRKERIVIVLHIARAVAHSMTVFTQKQRSILIFIFKIVFHALDRWVHLTYHIQNIIGGTVKCESALIMNRPCIIERFYEFGTCTEVFAPTALIANRPYNNARTVNITLY